MKKRFLDWLADNAVGILSLGVAAASTGIAAFAFDLVGVISSNPWAFLLVSVAAFLLGVSVCLASPTLSGLRDERNTKKSVARACAGMNERQRAVMWEAIDQGKVSAGLGDVEVDVLVKAGLLELTSAGYSTMHSMGDLAVPLNVARILKRDEEAYLGPRPSAPGQHPCDEA